MPPTRRSSKRMPTKLQSPRKRPKVRFKWNFYFLCPHWHFRFSSLSRLNNKNCLNRWQNMTCSRLGQTVLQLWLELGSPLAVLAYIEQHQSPQRQSSVGTLASHNQDSDGYNAGYNDACKMFFF